MKAKWLTIAYIIVAALLIFYLIWTLMKGGKAGDTSSRSSPAAFTTFAAFREPWPDAPPANILIG